MFTLMTMLLSVPTSEAEGVPESEPLAMLKLAQAGLFWMLKPSAPLEFCTAGVNEYSWPTWAFVEGEPLIVGAEESDEPDREELEELDTDATDADAPGAASDPLPPQPAVAARMNAQTANMLVLRIPVN